MSCTTNIDRPGHLATDPSGQPPPYAWTDLTYLLDRAGISWRYFVQAGAQPDCANPADMICPPQWQSHSTPDFWNPLPGFQTVQQDGQLHDVTSPSNYFQMARKGRLPSVSWIVPNGRNSEHPPASIANGQAWVTSIVERRDAEPRLEAHGDLPVVGRLGRLLRPRGAAHAERPGSRAPRARGS